MYVRHYAPKSPVRLVERLEQDDFGLTFAKASNRGQIQMPLDPKTYARALYAALHTLDRQKPPSICIESPPETEDWEAVWDRLSRASNR